MSEAHRKVMAERPAIYINAVTELFPQVVSWVQMGAEEEGVPCLNVSERLEKPNTDATTLAYVAAQRSPIGVGVGIAQGRITLHEVHLPAQKPIFSYELGDHPRAIAWLIGSNAGRFIKRMPLRFLNENTQTGAQPENETTQPVVRTSLFANDQTWDSGMVSQIVNQVLHTVRSNQ